MRLLKGASISKQRGIFMIFFIILPILVLMLTIIIPMLTSPMRRPQGMLRNHILRITPLGTVMEDVLEIIEHRNDFGAIRVNLERGFTPTTPGAGWPMLDGQPNAPIIGEMFISAGMGSYRAWYKWFPFMEWSVDVFWGFDTDGKLIEVQIRMIGMS